MMNEHSAQLAEARQIVEQLAAIGDQLSAGDKRFLTTWQCYLSNGDSPQIGRWRLFNLRRVAESYGVSVPEQVQIGAMDAPGYGLD
ncbi:MAG: hypothetical protein L0226_15090 [Acidobacteria bacterium]|nr:hypothetical protein [Acidobacteriota bacterium]